jgi:hypothetical protein
MSSISRRQFLKYLGAASALIATGRSGLAFGSIGNSRPFEMLVLGDSVASGHGLTGEKKFYSLAKTWLETEVFENSRSVDLKVKAHSGTTLSLHPKVAAVLARAELDEMESFHPEINIDYPTADKQVEIAVREYAAEGKDAKDVDLILLTCGINNITTKVILDPFGDDDTLRRDIKRYCHDEMLGLLRQTGAAFPNAKMALLGYFPLVSHKTSSGRFFNAILEVFGLPRLLKPLTNNLLTKQFFKIFHKKSAKRSSLWVEESNRCFTQAVEGFNKGAGGYRAVFIESPITEENCFGTKKPLVFGIGKKGRTGDLTYDARAVECRNAALVFQRAPELKYSVDFCRISGLAHPNVEGAKAYAESIKTVLGPILKQDSLGKSGAF